MASTTVWLVRHALAEGDSSRCCGHHDPPLSSEGLLQAKAVAYRLAGESIAHIYASSSIRALETARIIAEPHSRMVQTTVDFREIHFGDFEGLTYGEIENRWPDGFHSWMTQPTET